MAFPARLQSRSLRFWIMLGMMLALLPVVAAAVGGFALLHQGVIVSFQDLNERQRSEIIPAQSLGLMIWDAAIDVNAFVEEGNPTHQLAFRAARTDIESQFAALARSTANAPAATALVTRAREEWKVADATGGELISVLREAGDPALIETLERFDGAVRSASDSLVAAIEQIEAEVAEDDAAATLSYERALWLAAIAAILCIVTTVSAVLLIGRVMAASVDRLVDGALRFAEGDRSHRIDVRIPPELGRVANEFNRMITKIHAYEDVLADRALRDVLTGLPNRRAFDEAIVRQWDRLQRSGTPLTMLHIDIDHFKRVNDSYGHSAGDDVLRGAAEIMSEQMRPENLVYRLGGEEFAVVIPNADVSAGRVLAERLRAVMEARVAASADGRDVRVTISIGVADSKGHDAADEMIKAADAALYRAKTQGRNRVVTTEDAGRPRVHAA